MTYVICGLNGSLEKYNKLKEAARIGKNDIVYMLGGIAADDLSLLTELSMCENVYPVMDKSDYTALKMLGGFDKMLKSGETPDAKYITEMKKWVADGGQSVLDSYRTFDADMKEGVLDYLGDFALFEETDVKGKEYLLLSAGITGFSQDTDLYDLEPSNFISKPLDMDKKYFSDKMIVTASAKQEYSEITQVANNICLACGRAACIRLEDGEKFYV